MLGTVWVCQSLGILAVAGMVSFGYSWLMLASFFAALFWYQVVPRASLQKAAWLVQVGTVGIRDILSWKDVRSKNTLQLNPYKVPTDSTLGRTWVSTNRSGRYLGTNMIAFDRECWNLS